jgi:hypothetical protein
MFTRTTQVDTQTVNALETMKEEETRRLNMASKKTSAKKAPAKKVEAKVAPAKKAPAKKAVAEKATPAKSTPVAKKVPAKKAPAKKAVAKTAYTSEQVYSMIEQAAYFAAVNDGFQRDPAAYWTQAEAEINAMVKG